MKGSAALAVVLAALSGLACPTAASGAAAASRAERRFAALLRAGRARRARRRRRDEEGDPLEDAIALAGDSSSAQDASGESAEDSFQVTTYSPASLAEDSEAGTVAQEGELAAGLAMSVAESRDDPAEGLSQAKQALATTGLSDSEVVHAAAQGSDQLSDAVAQTCQVVCDQRLRVEQSAFQEKEDAWKEELERCKSSKPSPTPDEVAFQNALQSEVQMKASLEAERAKAEDAQKRAAEAEKRASAADEAAALDRTRIAELEQRAATAEAKAEKAEQLSKIAEAQASALKGQDEAALEKMAAKLKAQRQKEHQTSQDTSDALAQTRALLSAERSRAKDLERRLKQQLAQQEAALRSEKARSADAERRLKDVQAADEARLADVQRRDEAKLADVQRRAKDALASDQQRMRRAKSDAAAEEKELQAKLDAKAKELAEVNTQLMVLEKSLRSEKAKLKQTVAMDTSKITEAQKLIDEALEADRRDVAQITDRMQRTLADEKAKTTAAEQSLQQSQEDLHATKEELLEAQKRLDTADEERDALHVTRKKLVDTEKSLKSMEEELRSEQAKLTATEAKLKATETADASKLASVQGVADEDRDALDAARTKLVETEKRLKSMEEQLRSEQAKLTATEAKLKDTEATDASKIASVQGVADEDRDALHATRAKLVETQEHLKSVEEQLRSQQAKLTATEAKLKDMEVTDASKLASVQGAADEDRDALHATRAKLVEAQKRLKAMEEQLRSQQAALEDTQASDASKIASVQRIAKDALDNDRKEVEQTLGKMRRKLADESEKDDSNVRKLRQTEAELKVAKAQLVEATRKIADESATDDSDVKKLRQTEAELKAAKAQLADWKKRMDYMDEALRSQQAAVAKGADQLKHTESIDVAKIAAIERIADADRRGAEQVQEKLRRDLAEQAGRTKEAERRAADAEAETTAARQALAAKQSELDEALKQSAGTEAALRSQRAVAQRDEQALRQTKASDADKMDTFQRSVQEAVAADQADSEAAEGQLRRDLRAETAKHAKAEQRLAAALKRAQDSEAALRSEQAKSAELQQKLAATTAADEVQIQGVERIAKEELEKDHKDVQEVQRELADETASAGKSEKSLVQARDSAVRKLKLAEEQLEKKSAELADVSKRLEDEDSEMRLMRSKAASAEQRVQELEEQLAQKTSADEQDEESDGAALEHYKRELEAKKAVVSDETKTVRADEAALRSAKGLVAKLEARLRQTVEADSAKLREVKDRSEKALDEDRHDILAVQKQMQRAISAEEAKVGQLERALDETRAKDSKALGQEHAMLSAAVKRAQADEATLRSERAKSADLQRRFQAAVANEAAQLADAEVHTKAAVEEAQRNAADAKQEMQRTLTKEKDELAKKEKQLEGEESGEATEAGVLLRTQRQLAETQRKLQAAEHRVSSVNAQLREAQAAGALHLKALRQVHDELHRSRQSGTGEETEPEDDEANIVQAELADNTEPVANMNASAVQQMLAEALDDVHLQAFDKARLQDELDSDKETQDEMADRLQTLHAQDEHLKEQLGQQDTEADEPVERASHRRLRGKKQLSERSGEFNDPAEEVRDADGLAEMLMNNKPLPEDGIQELKKADSKLAGVFEKASQAGSFQDKLNARRKQLEEALHAAEDLKATRAELQQTKAALVQSEQQLRQARRMLNVSLTQGTASVTAAQSVAALKLRQQGSATSVASGRSVAALEQTAAMWRSKAQSNAKELAEAKSELKEAGDRMADLYSTNKELARTRSALKSARRLLKRIDASQEEDEYDEEDALP